MLRSMLHVCSRRLLFVLLASVGIAACANSGKTATQDNSGDGDGGGGPRGPIGGDGTVGGGDDGSATIDIGDGSIRGDSSCQHFDVQFLPKTPLVYVLADRSGSMFQPISNADGGTSNEWVPLRTATLAVIQGLESQVAFGFGAYTGINPNTTANQCPILDSVPVALTNYQSIANVYNSLGQPMFKAETPAQKTLEVVAQALSLAASQDAGGGQPGGKYILFVTDGETDFCDDPNPVCPADAVVAELQKLYSQGIQTLILGIGSSLTSISTAVLQDFANAGAGIATLAPASSAQGAPLSPSDLYNQCNGVTGWHDLFTSAGLGAGQALGTYAAPGTAITNATLYTPDATNVTDLTSKFAAALRGVKSCSFDLQGKIKVDLPNAGKGRVTINGTAVPFDPANGWSMGSPTQLDLAGASCQMWRAIGTDISFDFPCEIIIPLAQ
jgi:hypothetical protein